MPWWWEEDACASARKAPEPINTWAPQRRVQQRSALEKGRNPYARVDPPAAAAVPSQPEPESFFDSLIKETLSAPISLVNWFSGDEEKAATASLEPPPAKDPAVPPPVSPAKGTSVSESRLTTTRTGALCGDLSWIARNDGDKRNAVFTGRNLNMRKEVISDFWMKPRNTPTSMKLGTGWSPHADDDEPHVANPSPGPPVSSQTAARESFAGVAAARSGDVEDNPRVPTWLAKEDESGSGGVTAGALGARLSSQPLGKPPPSPTLPSGDLPSWAARPTPGGSAPVKLESLSDGHFNLAALNPPAPSNIPQQPLPVPIKADPTADRSVSPAPGSKPRSIKREPTPYRAGSARRRDSLAKRPPSPLKKRMSTMSQELQAMAAANHKEDAKTAWSFPKPPASEGRGGFGSGCPEDKLTAGVGKLTLGA